MDTPKPQPEATPHADVEAEHLAEVTKMSVDSSRTFLDFHSGMRWLRRDPE